MEESLGRIVFDLETYQATTNPNQDQSAIPPISKSTLVDLKTLIENITKTNDTEDAEHFWEELASKNISPASFLRILTTSMDASSSSGGGSGSALLASQVYLSLLLLPNSPVFTLFTPLAFLSLLRSLRRSFKNHKTNQNGENSSGGAKAKNRKRKGGGGRARVFSQEEEEEGDVFDVRVLFPVLEKLELVLSLIHLNRFPDSLKSLIQTIAEIPITALEFYENSSSYHRLSDFCFRILNGVLKPEHGDQTSTSIEVLKALSPAILLLKSQVRVCALKFVTDKMMVLAKSCEAVKKAIVYLPRYLVGKAPEKSEPRGAAVESIMEIVRVMEFEDQIGFVDYVVKMTQGKPHFRLMAVDLIPILLTSLTDPLGLNAEDGSKDWWGLRCLDGLVQRCADSGALIRARALSNLAHVVEFFSSDAGCLVRLKEILGLERDRNTVGGLNEILRKRCLDEKAAVRKAALLLISKSTALLGGVVDDMVLKTMGIACADPLVSIRKAAISALSEVFRKCSDERVVTEWLHSVPRLITDNESSIQTECEKLFLELVLDRVSKVGSLNPSSRCSGVTGKKRSFEAEIESVFSEGVLILLKGLIDNDVAPCLKKICTSLGKKKQLKPALAFALQNIIQTSESLWLNHLRPIDKWTAPPGAWLLVSEVSAFLPKAVGWEFLHHHWQLLDKTEVDELRSPLVQGDFMEEFEGSEPNSAAWAGDRVYLLLTISNVAVELPAEPVADLAHNLLKRIEEFNMHPTEINAHVKALRTLCKRKALNPGEGDNLVLKWVQLLLSRALSVLESYISEVSEASEAGGFLTPPRSTSRKGRNVSTVSCSLSKAVAAVYTIGSLVMVSPAADLKGIVGVLHPIITSGSSGPKMKKLPGPTVSLKQMPPSVYVQSWLTMGKICLADDKLAKRYIPLFVQELEKNECAALRNNIVVVLTDFCVRYTALVDCYICKITNCLRDPCEVVRRQTFILLSRLLQRDYVKWRGVLFLRFLLCLVDDSEKIRQLADFLFGNILKAKAPLLAYNSFVEAIFVLNDCHSHAGHSGGSHSSGTESRLFSIRGSDEKSRSQRMHVYAALLKQMAPEHLLATSAKLCAEILAAASDGLLNLDDITAQCVLQDALQLLACKEIRIQPNRGSSTEADIDEEGGDSGGAEAATAAKRRAVAQIAKKGLIQIAVPIFIELKRLLESRKSPLTGCLMECLRVLLKDYKNEIEDILIADKQLKKELIYDMEKYEAAKTKSTVIEAVATIQRSTVFVSPPRRGTCASKLPSELDITEKLAVTFVSPERVASVMADVAAEATVKSVLREVNRGTPTPQLNSIGMPKVKSCVGGAVSRDRPRHVLESVRRRQNFDSDDEN